MDNKTVFSGIQPTGELHVGNYFGAVKNWVRLQDLHRCFFCVVDMHSMTMPYDVAVFQKNTEEMFVSLLACGLDPKRCTVFIQSMVPQHAELNWILSCVASYGDLTRQIQFKEKSEQLAATVDDPTSGGFISAGLFNYPVLQAADILLYHGAYVPVGRDQEQHLELSRVIARRFNKQFGRDYFPEPKVLSTELPKLLSLADPGKKMSKSLGEKHVVPLFGEERVIRARVRSAITDSGETPEGELSPGVQNLLGLLRACDLGDTAATFENQFRSGDRKYAPLKDAVADALVALSSGVRARRAEIAADRDAIHKLMHETADQARTVAAQTITDVRRLVGLPQR